MSQNTRVLWDVGEPRSSMIASWAADPLAAVFFHVTLRYWTAFDPSLLVLLGGFGSRGTSSRWHAYRKRFFFSFSYGSVRPMPLE